MRTTRALVPALALALVLPAAPAGAAEPVGGPQLGGRAVAVAPGLPPLPAVSAASFVLADLDTGEVLAAKDAHGRYAPASTLKTLTALALIPELPADRKVVPTFDDVNVEGSKVGLVQRVGYPVHELLTALLVVSGNDAANTLASAYGGQAATARLMNETAAKLQALDTRAVNPHGLDAPGQVSSAYDLALIARAGMRNADFARYVAVKRSSVSAPGKARIEIYTKNKLLRNYDGALGIKNGFTSRARASFVGAAQRGGRRLVVTLMKADPRVWVEAGKLLDWGFAHGSRATAVGQLVEPLEPVAEEAAAAPARARVTTASVEAPVEKDSSVPLTVVGVASLVVAVGAVRRRRPV